MGLAGEHVSKYEILYIELWNNILSKWKSIAAMHSAKAVEKIKPEKNSGIAAVLGLNPVQAWIFFRLNYLNCLGWVHNYNDLSCVYFYYKCMI